MRSGNMIVKLESLAMDGDTITDGWMKDLPAFLALHEVKELDLSCQVPAKSRLSNRGLNQLAAGASPRFSELETLILSGHAHISGASMACIVSASPNLKELNLRHCKGLSTDIGGMERLCQALHRNQNSKANSSLERLTLEGCFSTRAQAQTNVRQFANEVRVWERLLDSILLLGPRLEYLNISHVFAVRPKDIDKLRYNCPKLAQDGGGVLDIYATCAWEKQQQSN